MRRPRRRIVVGAPARMRHWVMPTWRAYIDAEIEAAGLTHGGYRLVLAGGDDRTRELVDGWDNCRFVTVAEPERPHDHRNWTANRLALMVGLRNLLLQGVRLDTPDLFLSIDTDMLLGRGVLANLVATLDEHTDDGAAAVGGKAFMVGGGKRTAEPSFAMIQPPSFGRWDSDQVLEVDVIMGIKLMAPAAYQVDYVFDRSGEDIGWSNAVKAAGGRLWWDGRVCSKHVAEYPWLYLPDPRVGF